MVVCRGKNESANALQSTLVGLKVLEDGMNRYIEAAGGGWAAMTDGPSSRDALR